MSPKYWIICNMQPERYLFGRLCGVFYSKPKKLWVSSLSFEAIIPRVVKVSASWWIMWWCTWNVAVERCFWGFSLHMLYNVDLHPAPQKFRCLPEYPRQILSYHYMLLCTFWNGALKNDTIYGTHKEYDFSGVLGDSSEIWKSMPQ